MAEEIKAEQKPFHLGVEVNRSFTRAGKRRRTFSQEQNPLTDVKRVRIDGFEGYSQEFKSNSSSSNWKEYLADKRRFGGVLLDNNMLLWFPFPPELDGNEVVNLAIQRHPDSRPSAKFVFGNRGQGISSSDLSIISLETKEDPHITKLLDYFGKSLDWSKDTLFSVRYADVDRGIYQSDFQQYQSKTH